MIDENHWKHALGGRGCAEPFGIIEFFDNLVARKKSISEPLVYEFARRKFQKKDTDDHEENDGEKYRQEYSLSLFFHKLSRSICFLSILFVDVLGRKSLNLMTSGIM